MGFLFGEDKKAKEIECRRGGKHNAVKFDYCTKCGLELEKPSSEGRPIISILLAPVHLLFGKYEPPPPYKYCAEHAIRYVPEAQFCGYCGEKLVPFREKPINARMVFKMFCIGVIGFGVGFLVAPSMLATRSAEAEMCVRCIIGFVGILFGVVIAQDPGIVGRIFKRILIALAAAIVMGFVNYLNTAK